MSDFLRKLEDRSRNGRQSFRWANTKYFVAGFYYHMIQGNLAKAKKMYKQALMRAECPRGAFNLIVSILVRQCGDDGYLLQKKIEKLLEKVEHYVSRDEEAYHYTRTRISSYINYLASKEEQ